MKRNAFTLIEITIVIGLIALLSVFGLTAYNRAQRNALITKTQADLKEINTALIHLGLHTEQIPMHYPANGACIQNNEVSLTDCRAGLLCTDGDFPNWQGPYIDSNLLDEWGSPYQFDPDYRCSKEVSGCESVPEGKIVRAIYSVGPDKQGGYNPDNIVFILCD